jgi:hypothetical protein
VVTKGYASLHNEAVVKIVKVSFLIEKSIDLDQGRLRMELVKHEALLERHRGYRASR